MKTLLAQPCRWLLVMGMLCIAHVSVTAQTDIDAIMMSKNNFCIGGMYSSSHWTDYWEGTLKRTNDNLGNVSMNMAGFMGTYGVSGKLNLLVGLPYVQTKASAGTLHGDKGFQDLSLWVKWMPVETHVGNGLLSVYGIGGFSFPVTNYNPDFLPMSIGMHSKNLSLRAMADYQAGHLFATASGTYVVRSNIKIDRTSYYTTELHLTNEVEMPDQSSFNIRAGYRSGRLIAEAIYNQMYTLGGFDITRNNMPFASNRMNASTLGINLKYTLKAISGLSLIGGGETTLAGRNVGQANSLTGGIFYILDFSHKQKKSVPASNQK